MQDKALIYDYSDNRCFCILMAIVVCSLHVTECSDVNATSIAIIYSSPRDIAFENSIHCTVQFINDVILLNKSIELHANITHIERDLTGVSAFKTGLSLQENGGFVAVIGPMARRDIIVLQPHIAALNIPHIIPKSYSSSFQYESSAYPMLVRLGSNDFTDQINGILEVMLKMQWTSIGLLIQKDSFYQAVSRKFYFLAKSVNIEVTFFMEFDEINVGTANTKDQIQTITKSGQRFILLLTSERLVNSVLQQASSCGLNEPNWVWILWSDVFDTMKNMTNFGITSGIALRQQFTATNFSKRLKKCEIPQNLIVRKYIDSMLALSYGLKSLLDDNGKVTLPSLGKYLSWEFGQNLFKHILSANHSNNDGVLSENIRFNVTTAELMSEAVFDVINLQNNTWVTVGNFSEHSSGESVLKLEHDRVVIGAKHNESYSCHMTLENSKLRVATMHAPPFVMTHTYEAKYSGYAFDIFYKLQKDIGFSAEIFNIFSGAFGAKDPLSGDWNGLIGEIVEGRADIAVGPITLTDERQKVVDFTESFLKTNLKYIIDIQAAGGLMAGYDRYGFLRPFTWTLWLVIALCVLAVGVYFTLISHLSPYGAHGHYFQSDEAEAANIRMERRRSSVMTISGVSSSSLFKRRSSSISHNTQYKGNEEKGVGWKSNKKSRQIGPAEEDRLNAADSDESDEESRSKAQRQMSLSNALYFACAGLLWQSPESVPRAPSSRIVAAIWYMVGVIIVASYTANMVTFVSIKIEASHLLSVRELLSQSYILPGTVSSSSVETLLKTSQIPIAQKLYDALLLDPQNTLQPNQSMAMKKVKSGKVAFIWESALLDYSAMKSGCKLTTVRLGFGHSTYAFVLKSGSPYTAEISKHIKVLEENGFLKELNKKYFPKNCTDGSETNENTHLFDAIRWTSLVGVADLLLYAAAFSIIVLMMEWVVASLSDIDKTNPKAPATFKRAILARWRRMLTDAKQNWLPFQTTRQHWARNASKKGASVLQRNKVEPDQWKRYTSSTDAINLKPGQSISNPLISDP